jgi:hypothetical protein
VAMHHLRLAQYNLIFHIGELASSFVASSNYCSSQRQEASPSFIRGELELVARQAS